MLKKLLRIGPLWIILLYRYGRWLHIHFKVPVIKTILGIPYSVITNVLEIILGIHIPWTADIGKGFYIGHFGGIWLGNIKMGEYCNISQGVTIGIGGRGEFRGVPEIGDRVYIGPGAKIFGKIRIGNNVAIGANAVVSKSLPDNAVAVGNPARIVGYEGSSEVIMLQE